MKTKLIRTCLLIPIVLFHCPMLSGQGTLRMEKINKVISMEISDEFIIMEERERIQKYVSSRAPIAMYHTMDKTVDLGINVNSTQWYGEIEILKDFYQSNILNLFSEVQFITDEVREINGREFIVFEFVGKIEDEENVFGNRAALTKYIYIQYTLYQDQVLLFNFSCPTRVQSSWQPAARQMMSSVRIKD